MVSSLNRCGGVQFLFKVVLRVCFTTICKETRAMFFPGLALSRLCSLTRC